MGLNFFQFGPTIPIEMFSSFLVPVPGKLPQA